MQVIYAVECAKTGLTYVGYSANHIMRWRSHRRLLRRKIHGSPKMVEDWHKYGPEAFAMRVLEVLPEKIEMRDARLAELRWQAHFAKLGRLYNEPKCSVCGRPYELGTTATPDVDGSAGEEMSHGGEAGLT